MRVSRNLGNPDAPPAVRAAPPGWRDPRLWIGVAIVAASVVTGARLVGAADDSVAVWATTSDLGAGDTVSADDLVAQRVRFVDDADLEHYFPADDDLPADLQLRRGVGDGELLPKAAVGPAGATDTMALPVAVDTTLVPPGVQSGWVVDVYLTGQAAADRAGIPAAQRSGPVLSEVTVIDAPPLDETLAVSGQRQVVLGVTELDARRFFLATGDIDAPTLTIVRRG